MISRVCAFLIALSLTGFTGRETHAGIKASLDPRIQASQTGGEPVPGKLAPNRFYVYVGDHPTARYTLGELTLTFHTTRNVEYEALRSVTVKVSAPHVPDHTYTLVDNTGVVIEFGAGRLDRKASGLQALFKTWTGGASCCTDISVIAARNGRWVQTDFDQWYDDLMPWPKDLDGDGYGDFVLDDESFGGMFGTYGLVRTPPKILNLAGGKIVDVSKHLAFNSLFQTDLIAAQQDCETKRDAPACAAFVADAARLGRKDWAWTVVEAHEPTQPPWGLTDWEPSACPIGTPSSSSQSCRTATFKNFLDSLDWYLRQTGYVS
jgi:hypothetical protein